MSGLDAAARPSCAIGASVLDKSACPNCVVPTGISHKSKMTETVGIARNVCRHNILERLAGSIQKVFLSQAVRVCEAECI